MQSSRAGGRRVTWYTGREVAVSSSIQCPTCGGTTELAFRFVRLVVCSYCGQTLALTAEGVDPTGKSATLTDFASALHTGAVASLGDRDLHVVGRVRYDYDDGYWDEWIVRFSDGTSGWIHEDEGELTLLEPAPLTRAPDLATVRVGGRIDVDGRSVYVSEKRTATIYGGEGQIPRDVRFGADLLYVDGTVGKDVVMLEVIDGRVEMFVGRVLGDDELDVREV